MRTRGVSERKRFKTYKRAFLLDFHEPEDLVKCVCVCVWECVCVLHNRRDVFEPKDEGDVTPLPNPFFPLTLSPSLSLHFYLLPLAATVRPLTSNDDGHSEMWRRLMNNGLPIIIILKRVETRSVSLQKTCIYYQLRNIIPLTRLINIMVHWYTYIEIILITNKYII